eukprot:Sdes_comp24707_c0_seq1m22491
MNFKRNFARPRKLERPPKVKHVRNLVSEEVLLIDNVANGQKNDALPVAKNVSLRKLELMEGISPATFYGGNTYRKKHLSTQLTTSRSKISPLSHSRTSSS